MPTRPMLSTVLEEGATGEKAAAMDKEQLARLARYLDEATLSTQNHKTSGVKVPCPATG